MKETQQKVIKMKHFTSQIKVLAQVFKHKDIKLNGLLPFIDVISLDLALKFKKISQKHYPERVLINDQWVIIDKDLKTYKKYCNQVQKLQYKIVQIVINNMPEDFNNKQFLKLLFYKIDKYQEKLQIIHSQIG